MKYQTINGWTVEKMKEQIRKKNNGKRAVGEHPDFDREICLYETPDGNHCAVGCFIPEGHKALSLGAGVDSLLDLNPELHDVFPLESEALSQLQSVHDGNGDNYDIRETLCRWIDQNVEN